VPENGARFDSSTSVFATSCRSKCRLLAPASLFLLAESVAGEGGSPDYACIFTEACKDNLDGLLFYRPYVLVKVLPYPFQEHVSGGNHSACKDYSLRLGGMEHIYTGDCKRFSRAIRYLFGQSVTCCQMFINILTGYCALFFKNCFQAGFGPCLNGLASPSGRGISGGCTFVRPGIRSCAPILRRSRRSHVPIHRC